MKLLRLLRQYDSVKAAVILIALAIVLTGYCIRSAVSYASFLQAPAEYVCTAPVGIEQSIPQLSNADGVFAYSRQKKAYLTGENQTVSVVMLSAAYLADCYALEGDTHMVWMNAEAFAAWGDAASQSTVFFNGTLDGKSFSAQLCCTENLPQGEPYAVLAASASDLHDADTLRICAANRDTFAPESLGLSITNPEQQCAADYEQKLVLLRIRFGAFSALLALLGAGAFLHICKMQRKKDACFYHPTVQPEHKSD